LADADVTPQPWADTRWSTWMTGVATTALTKTKFKKGSSMNTVTKEVASEYFGHTEGVLFWKKSTGPRAIVGEKIQTLSSHGYVALTFMGKAYKAHQIIFLLHHGYIPTEIDHINNIRSDNRIENLRPVSRSMNCANQSIQKRSASGYKGVTKVERLKKWRARIKHLQNEIYLGLFDTAEAAAEAYNKKAAELFGSFAKPNQIGELK
jgi:hypothetical protein